MKEQAAAQATRDSELEALRARLAEAEETLRAIRAGEVDALVVSTAKGNQVFTLAGAERMYRLLIETMNEGALTLAPDGSILYCNARFAALLKRPQERFLVAQPARRLAGVSDPAHLVAHQDGFGGLFQDRARQFLGRHDRLVALLLGQVGDDDDH